MIRRILRHRVVWVLVLVVGAAGLYWFQPWRLVTSTTVRDTLSAPAPASSAPSAPAAVASPAAAPGPVVLRQGTFVTHEHDTAGTARLIRDRDGSHRVELVGLDTSDGPDLRVWLTDQAVQKGRAGWHVFDDGEYVELGRLKGNRGDQVYRVDADVDPAQFRSISIWCKRFSVSFGAAPLA
jgi:hypothetical protein